MKHPFYYLLFICLTCRLYSIEEAAVIDFPEDQQVFTIDSAVSRALQFNLEIQDSLDSLRKADLSLSTESAYFSWEVAPDGIFGYTNRPHKKKDSDLSYGVGLSLSKKYAYGTRLHLAPSVSKKGKGYQADLSAAFVQPLFKGRGNAYNMSRIYGAKFSRRTAYRQFFIKQTKLIQDTIRDLYNVVKNKTIAEMNLESLQRLKELVRVANLKEKVGLANATDVYRAEHELKNTEERYESSINQLKDAEDRFKNRLDLPESLQLYIEVPVGEVHEKFELSDSLETAKLNRIELDQAMDVLAESKRLCALEKQDFLPELDLILEYCNASYYDSFRIMHPENLQKYWKVGLRTSKGLSTCAQLNRYELTRLAVKSSERGVEKAEDTIQQEVRRALRSYNSLRRKIEIQKEQLELSQVNLKLSTLKFNRGIANNFDLIQAEKNFQQERIRTFTQTIDQILELINLYVSMGVFCEKPNIPY